MHHGTCDTKGRFRVTDLLPGRYFIVASPRRLSVPLTFDAAFFERLSEQATALVVGADDHRTLELRMTAEGGSS